MTVHYDYVTAILMRLPSKILMNEKTFYVKFNSIIVIIIIINKLDVKLKRIMSIIGVINRASVPSTVAVPLHTCHVTFDLRDVQYLQACTEVIASASPSEKQNIKNFLM